MSTGQFVDDRLSDDEILAYTQAKRRELVSKMTETGIPEDNKDRLTLLAALDGMDRAALTVQKIASKEKTASADREAQMLIASIYGQLRGVDPFAVDQSDNGVIRRTQPLVLDESGMAPLESVPGETSIGTIVETSQEFLDRFGKNGPISNSA